MERGLDNIVNHNARLNWGAAVKAGLIGAGLLWLFSHGTPWFTSGMVSPTLMGRDLKPSGLVDGNASLMTMLAQVAVAIGYTLVIATAVSRIRGLWGVALGGIAGLVLYLANLMVFRLLGSIDWTRSEISVVVTHLVFGMVAAALYKGLAGRREPVRANPSATEL